MVKVDGSCVLVPVDEVTRMRPDMSAFVEDSFVREEVAEASISDPDYKPKSGKKKSEAKTAAKAVKVHPERVDLQTT